MTDPSTIETALARCENIRTLLAQLTRLLPAARDEALRLAGKDNAFAESLNDAIGLYLQRTDSDLDKAQEEFEPMLEMLAGLKRTGSSRTLMDWLDRHRQPIQPTAAQEKRFALALWTLMQITSPDSKIFVDWWMERAKLHEGDWLGEHFDPQAMAAKS